MADTGRLRAMEVFWSRDESDVDSSLVHVPGVSQPGNRRPSRPVKVKGRRTHEIKPIIPVSRRPVSEVKANPIAKQRQIKQQKTVTQQNRKDHEEGTVSLKDLCKEDKQRVANLINELARVGEEKNKVAQALNDEKLMFEHQMKELVQQQEKILKERQGTNVAVVQQQLWECQNLLSRYQKVVSQQQEVLTQHISEHQDLDQNSPRGGSGSDNGHVNQAFPEGISRGRLGNQPLAQKATRPPNVPNLEIPTQAAHPLTTIDQTSQCSSIPIADLSTGSETTPRGTKRPCVPSSEASSDRPFTAYIDGLIAREQETSKRHESLTSEGNNRKANRNIGVVGEESSSKATSTTSSRPYVKPPSSSSTGPLHEPVLSSTHQSDLFSVSHQSRTAAGEFQPLQPDYSSRSSLQSTTTQHPLDELSSYYRRDPPLSQDQTSLRRPPVVQALPPGSCVTFNEERREGINTGLVAAEHQLSDDDFVNYYKSMTPYERQRHLQTQKAALVAEQERLRHILEDQEQLLRCKQQQLHTQQHIQSSRLQHFEHTGAFPHEQMQDPTHHKSTFPPQPMPFSEPKHKQTPLDYSLHSNSTERTITSTNQPCADVRRDNNRHEMSSRVEDIQHQLSSQLSDFKQRGGQQLGNPDPRLIDFEPEVDFQENMAEISKEELDAVTESFENILFLQRHGIDVNDMRSSTNNVHRPISSHQGISPGGGRGPVSRPRVETMDDLLNNSRNSTDIIERDGTIMTRKTSKIRSSPLQINNGEHVAQLLDLVDEVESAHLGRPHHHHYHSPESGHYPGLGHVLEESGCVRPSEETMENADESQILEDVFFVK